MSNNSLLTEADILAEAIAPDEADYPRELAEAILRLKFSPKAVQRMHELAERNRQGSISDSDLKLMERYQRVGNLINLLQAKARLSLNKSSS